MVEKKTNSDKVAQLRQQAEAMAREKAAHLPEDFAVQSPEETRRTLHELHVHQIELEMQNEELRQAQAELGMERERYFDLYNLAPAGYLTLNEKGLIMEANLAAAGMLGAERSKLVNQRLSRFILKEDQDSYYFHRKQLLETGKPQNYELRMLKHGSRTAHHPAPVAGIGKDLNSSVGNSSAGKDATPFWAQLSTTGAQDGNGAPICRVVLSDITERKLTEQKLRETEEKYRVVSNNEIYAICIFDLETLKLLDVNDTRILRLRFLKNINTEEKPHFLC